MAGTINHLRSGQQLDQTNNAQNKKTQQSQSQASSTSVEKSGSHKPDAVSISSESRAIGALNQQIASEGQFDAAKVAEIKAAIANGSYQIDADKLASNMLKFEDEFRGKE
ncbi:flagellar biosynthesis anti-sigma factor FlgM [Veronia nyctiphanis]|uniref:Negative regulator of flagellin synthesis n=1 Tax=Veronia nyctiphanis TaxID=1278244 RepID=A0A4Q0YV95_9GAMM|nr:flagellar biosynthesis anti-sigma factor FlgM [Veronia nyctiphanis]RXJ72891.1 flagellar biosynthesis anti-sigma factor FlgM [Veronia nyctiphanis]